MGQEKGREAFQQEGAARTKAQRNEEHVGLEMASSSAWLEKVLVEQEKQSPEYMSVAHSLYTPVPVL